MALLVTSCGGQLKGQGNQPLLGDVHVHACASTPICSCGVFVSEGTIDTARAVGS